MAEKTIRSPAGTTAWRGMMSMRLIRCARAGRITTDANASMATVSPAVAVPPVTGGDGCASGLAWGEQATARATATTVAQATVLPKRARCVLELAANLMCAPPPRGEGIHAAP